MATNNTFMDYCNLVLEDFNEVPFTQNTFDAERGFHQAVKNWVNASIRTIHQKEVEWPFNYSTKSETLVAEQNTYDYPTDVQWIDFEGFHLEADDALNVDAKHLEALTYDQWNMYHRARDENNATGIRIPNFVAQLPNDQWAVTPIPDRAYTVSYPYYGFSSKLEAYNDTTTIPDRFEDVIKSGAMYYAYLFRDNYEAARVAKKEFKDGIKMMRTVLINKYKSVSDTRVDKRRTGF